MENNQHSGVDGHVAHSTSLEQWLRTLESLHPNPIDLGLDRIAAVASRLDLLPIQAPVITVAGTNGKGSTVAVLEAVLEQAGVLTGVFTSPHLLQFNERIRVGMQNASDREIVLAFEAIEEARGATSLTYFEFAALAALLVFRKRTVDVLVLEVGLGGRLDAVNIVDAEVAVITPIDLDHQAWLGNDRNTIAREKAGIMRRGKAVVIGDPQPPSSLFDRAQSIGATPVLCVDKDFSIVLEGALWSGSLRGNGGKILQLPALERSHLHPGNIATALQAAIQLGWTFDQHELESALARARPRGRCERLKIPEGELVLDVAHNPAAVYNLVEYLNLSPCNRKTICVFSAMKDKDIDAMIAAAGQHFHGWFLADQLGNERVALAADIALLLEARGQQVYGVSSGVQQAFHQARDRLNSGDRLVVFGSFSTVAGVLPLLDLAS